MLRTTMMALAVAALATTAFTATAAHAQTWTQTATPPGGTVWGMAQIGTTTFAGTTSSSVYRSTNAGASWTSVGPAGGKVRSLHVASGVLFAGLDTNISPGMAAIWRSTNSGTTWTPVIPLNAVMGPVHAITSGPGYFLAATNNGVLRSTTGTGGWTPSNTGLNAAGGVRSLALSGSTVYAGTYGQGVFQSTNGGVSWTNIGLGGKYIQALLISGNAVYAGGISGSEGVWKKTGTGAFVVANTGLPLNSNNNLRDVYAFYQLGSTIYVGHELGGSISKTVNGGATWTAAGAGISTPNSGRSFTYGNGTMYAGTDVGVWKWPACPCVAEVQ